MIAFAANAKITQIRNLNLFNVTPLQTPHINDVTVWIITILNGKNKSDIKKHDIEKTMLYFKSSWYEYIDTIVIFRILQILIIMRESDAPKNPTIQKSAANNPPKANF